LAGHPEHSGDISLGEVLREELAASRAI